MKCILAIFLASLLAASAQQQKVDAPVNKDGRTLSFYLYHFDTQRHHVQLHHPSPSLEKALSSTNSLAGITVWDKPTRNNKAIQLQHASLRVQPLVEQSAALSQLDVNKHARRTFLLHDGKNHWAIGYATSLNQQQLAHALAYICKQGNMRYTDAYLLNTGNSTGFWAKNGNYHPFYLKELKSPHSVLSIRSK